MNRVKKLFSPQAGDTYHSHQAGVPDGVYHRQSVDETAGIGSSSSTEDKPTSGTHPISSSYTSEQQASTAAGESSYGESARRVYSSASQTSGPAERTRTRTTSAASKPTSPTKYTIPTNFAYGGPLYQSKSSTPDPTPTTKDYETASSTRDYKSTSPHTVASPANDAMTSNSSSQLPPGAFVDDTPNSARSAVGAAGPSRGTTGAPQIARQDLGESLDNYSTGTTSRSGTTGTSYDGSAAAAGPALTGATLADRSVSGGNTSGRPGADYKGTDNFTPHPHDVDASNKPLAAPEDNDAVRTSEPATTIAARVMGAGGGETSSYSSETASYTSSGTPGIASTTSGNTAMPSSNTSGSGRYGRDAELGAGAAGTTMLSGRTGDGLDPSDSGPASSTVGPHNSNFANIMDPRVKPDPSKMHGSDAAATTGGSAAGAGAFPAGTATSSQPTNVGGTGVSDLTGAAGHDTYAHGKHPDAAPYSTERHVERDLYEREQTKGGLLGSVHKHQESKYADKDEPNTTARDKYYGNDGATHPMSGAGSSTGTGVSGTAFDEGGHHGTSGHGGQSIGGGAAHRAYDDAGTGTTSHDYGTGQSGTKDSSQASPADSGRTSLDSEGRPKKRGLMDKILHR